MGMNIDDALARLAAEGPHQGLSGFEHRVLCAISSRPAAEMGAGATVAAMGLALTLGLVSNVMPASNARGAATSSPLGVPSSLAPSTLLGATR